MSRRAKKKQKKILLKDYLARKGLFIQEKVPSKLKTLEPEITLGRKILDRAVLDAVDDVEAEEWFNTLNEDYLTICYIAHLDPEITLNRFQSTIKRLKAKEYIHIIMKEIEE